MKKLGQKVQQTIYIHRKKQVKQKEKQFGQN